MPLREDLLNPIPGENPSGKNLRYDPVTDKIKEARREDLDVPQGDWRLALKVADHAAVIKLAGEAIATRSKDLQLAVWLVEAHVKREGWAVVAPCLDFLRNLIEQFWDTLYPEIEDGDVELRAAPLDWLALKFEQPVRGLPITSNGLSWFKYKESRAVGYEADAESSDERTKQRNQLISEGKLTAEEFDAAADQTPAPYYEKLQGQIETCLASLEALNEICDQRFGEFAPSVVKLRTAFEEIGQIVRVLFNKKGGAAPAPAAAPPEPEETYQEPQAQPVYAAPAGAAAAPAPARAGGGIVPSDVDDAARRLGAIARFLRAQDVYNIGPYLILRGFRWGEIRYNGPDIDGSMLAAPPADLRSRLARFAAEGNWDQVLETTEAAMELPCGRAWLDLQRHAVRALDAKGQWFCYVSGAIRTALRGLLEDLPGLLDKSLADGTPVADEETRAWIESEVLGGKPLAAPPPAAPVYEAPAPPPSPPANLPSVPLVLEQDKPPAEGAEPDAFDLAVAAAREGNEVEGLGILRKALASEQTGRGRFRRRAQIAHVLLAGGRDQVAYPILEQLSNEIDERRLEEWEAGDALAYPLWLLLRCMAADGESPGARKQIYARICRLDPVQALNCSE